MLAFEWVLIFNDLKEQRKAGTEKKTVKQWFSDKSRVLLPSQGIHIITYL